MEDHTIPAGYILEIYTWENDMDNCQTQRKEGLTETRARCYLEICRRFKSIGHRGGEEFGNEEPNLRYKEVNKFVEQVCNKHGIEYHEDLLPELIDTWNYGVFYRVFDKARLFYVAKPIIMKQLDADKF